MRETTPGQEPPPTEAAKPTTILTAPSTVPAPDAARATAVRELRERMMLMAARISAVGSGIENLRQEQERSGLTMRGDITASWKRMEFRMDEAESATKDGDTDAARKNLDLAERELGELERFLNL